MTFAGITTTISGVTPVLGAGQHVITKGVLPLGIGLKMVKHIPKIVDATTQQITSRTKRLTKSKRKHKFIPRTSLSSSTSSRHRRRSRRKRIKV